MKVVNLMRHIMLQKIILKKICSLLFLCFIPFSVSFAEEYPNSILVGKVDAPITIVEYASLSCPYCASFHKSQFPQIKAQFIDTGIAKFYIMDYPHNNAGLAATVVKRCAPAKARLGLYELILKNQPNWLAYEDVREPLRKYAALAGVSAAKMEECLANKELVEEMFADIKVAEGKGVSSIPTVFVNGNKVDASFAAIAEAVKAAQ